MERREPRRVDRFELRPEPCSHGPFAGYTQLDRINSAARSKPELQFEALLPHLNPENLRQAFRQIDGLRAVGIDQVTKQDYQRNLDENLARLALEIQRGGWRPKPTREVLIPKSNGGTRPLAIGCLEDKIVQLLCGKILEAIYEDSFHRHSYGFRPKRNAHQALARLYSVIRERQNACWVVEMDIEKFFNSVNHERLMEILSQRIRDSHFLRLIRRMLRNSVLSEDGEIRQTERGTPQGAPISPILANIYLHFCLDAWFDESWEDQGQMIRYADDAVFVFTNEQKAAEFKAALKTRLSEFGALKLNEDKSGCLQFDCLKPQGQLPFLGFCLYWGKDSRKKKPLLKVKTAPKKLAASLTQFTDWIKANRCRKRLDDLWDLAAAKLRGHYGFYGVSFNRAKLSHYYHACIGALFKWLNRRSQKRSFTWERFQRRLMFKPLPRPTASAMLIDITLGLVSGSKHQTRSRMRKLRTYGSKRSLGLTPVFT